LQLGLLKDFKNTVAPCYIKGKSTATFSAKTYKRICLC